MSSGPKDQNFQIDLATLKLSITLPDRGPDEDDLDEEVSNYTLDDDEEGEFAFTKEYRFSIADPNPPPRPPSPIFEEDDPNLSNLSPTELFFHKFATQSRLIPKSMPLLEITVRTIDRSKVPRGQFYSYMDNVCENFLQFSMAVFTNDGRIKQSLCGSLDRGTGVWGSEINHGTLAYIEYMKVNPAYRQQGVGRWAIKSLLASDVLAHCPYFFAWATPINDKTTLGLSQKELDTKKKDVIAFWRSLGFRRVGGTWFFGYARDPQRPMRALKAEDDAEEMQTKVASIFGVY